MQKMLGNCGLWWGFSSHSYLQIGHPGCTSHGWRGTEDDEQCRKCWGIAAYGGVLVLIHICKSGTPAAQAMAGGALRNVAAVEEIRKKMAEEGAITVLLNLVSSGFLKQLASILKNGHSTVQQLAASSICNLSFSNETKKELGEAGCIPPLVKMLEAKTSISQEAAAQAISALLFVQTNRKEFIKDDKSEARLVQSLDSRNQTLAEKFPLSALLALSTSKTYRKKKIATAGACQHLRKKIDTAGACQHLQKLTEMEVAGAKKILQRLAGSWLHNIFSRRWRE